LAEKVKNLDSEVAYRKQHICNATDVKVMGGTIWQSGGAFHGARKTGRVKLVIL
jgi:hypothetical protein